MSQSTKTTRLSRRAGLGALLATAVMVASMAAPAAGQAGSPVLGDGLWRVVFFLDQRATLAGTEFDYTGHGSSIIQVTDGSASGEWNLSLSTVVIGTNSASNGVAIGTVSGNALEQVLDFDTVTVTDATFGITVTLTAEELPVSGGGTLTPTGRGCSALTGEWIIPFNDQQLEGQFIAQRLGTGGGETDADLRDTGLGLIEQARTGTIDASALSEFIRQAEAGSEATARDDGCDAETAGIFGTAATLLVNSVLVEAGFATTDLDDAEFMEFYRAALRSGLFEMYPETRLTWGSGLRNRLAAAIGSDDPAVWTFWLPIARQLGDEVASRELAINICRERGDFFCEGVDE